MKIFKDKSYYMFNDKTFSIVILSDLHFSKKVKDIKLNKIINHIKKLNPTYVLFAGDLINNIDSIEDKNECKRLINFLKELTSITKVLMILGNHDFYKKAEKGNTFRSYYIEPTKLLKKLSTIDNLYLLRNEVYKDKNIYVFGLEQSMTYYNEDKKKESKTIEKVSALLEDLNKLDNKYFKRLPNNKVNILLTHSPIDLINPKEYLKAPRDEKEIYKKIREFDYFICGHMHNGCVPPIIDEIFGGTRGIITPTLKLFSKNCRNTFRKNDDKLLVNGSLTMFSENTKALEKANALVPMHISIMNFGPNYPFYDKEFKYRF